MDVLFSAFVMLLIVVDPIGNAPIFTALTHNMAPAYCSRMAIRGVALATAILVVFLLVGHWLLETLSIGISAFRIAGGILLFLLAIEMAFARQFGLRSPTVQEQQEAGHKRRGSVFPLAFPLITGPGVLTTMLLVNWPWPES
jgi:multiple antibiotic resistance protein